LVEAAWAYPAVTETLAHPFSVVLQELIDESDRKALPETKVSLVRDRNILLGVVNVPGQLVELVSVLRVPIDCAGLPRQVRLMFRGVPGAHELERIQDVTELCLGHGS
jgi:hypothetical protein